MARPLDLRLLILYCSPRGRSFPTDTTSSPSTSTLMPTPEPRSLPLPSVVPASAFVRVPSRSQRTRIPRAGTYMRTLHNNGLTTLAMGRDTWTWHHKLKAFAVVGADYKRCLVVPVTLVRRHSPPCISSHIPATLDSRNRR